jgi:hypothetical protein
VTIYLSNMTGASVDLASATYNVGVLRPGAGDPYFSNVVMLMHMADASLSDLKGNGITLYDNCARSSFGAGPFGGYSATFDGTGDYLEVANSTTLQFGTGGFTLEFFVKTTSTANQTLYDFRPIDGNGAYHTLFIVPGGALVYYANSANRIATASAIISTGTWYHIALCRVGTSTRLFLDGVQVGSTYSDSTNYQVNGSFSFRLGRSSYTSIPYYFQGEIAELRGSSLGRYSGTFTPPPAPFSDF